MPCSNSTYSPRGTITTPSLGFIISLQRLGGDADFLSYLGITPNLAMRATGTPWNSYDWKHTMNRSRIRINKWYQSFALRNFDLEDMAFESTNSSTTAKLPILKLENGDSWVLVPQTAQENGTSVTKMSIPVTAEEKTSKKNDVKARSLLLKALPNEHQLIFSQYPDAKSIASSADSLDSIFNRLQKIVSRLAILGVVIAQEELNSNFLSSLPPEWNTHVVVWMNKPEVETMSIDDLSFMVKNPNGSNLLHQDLEQIHEDDLKAMDLKWHLSLLSMRAK
ncbi:hypothetical protein Tco_0850680, partial [Tanacetum coccineum]